MTKPEAKIATIGDNVGPTTKAEGLLETFDRVPEELDVETARLAVVLAKQALLALKDYPDTSALPNPLKPTKEALEGVRGTLLERLGVYMRSAGTERVQSDYGPVAFFKDTVGYKIEDEAAIPEAFTKRVPDTKAIGKAIKAGEAIPGVTRTESTSVVVS